MHDTPEADAYVPTERTRVRRRKQRGAYDKATVHAILDAGLVCHLGFVHEHQPLVIPTIYVRDGETIYFHGSSASRMLRTLAQGVDACLTVSHIDGLVLARSAFHHSMNYRSVVVIGKAHRLDDRDEMLRAMQLITNRIVDRRWEEVRRPNELELRQINVLALPLAEVSAKIRDEAVIDDEEDYALPIWAGVIPVTQRLGEPIPDSRNQTGLTAPSRERVMIRI